MPNGESLTIIDELRAGIKVTDRGISELDKTANCPGTCGEPHIALVTCVRGQAQMVKGLARFTANTIEERKTEKDNGKQAIITGLVRLVVALVLMAGAAIFTKMMM